MFLCLFSSTLYALTRQLETVRSPFTFLFSRLRKSISYSLSQSDPSLCYCTGFFHFNSRTAHFLCGEVPLNPHLQPFENPLNDWPYPELIECSPHWSGFTQNIAVVLPVPLPRSLLQTSRKIIFRSGSWETPLAISSLLDFILLITTPWPNNTCEVCVFLCCIWFWPVWQMSLNMRALTSDPIWPSKKFFSVDL